MLLHCSYFGTSFGESIWRLNTYISSLLIPLCTKFSLEEPLLSPPQMLAFTALLSLQCHNPLAQHTAAAALREKQLSGGAFPLKRTSLTQRRTVAYHIQGATKPCSRNHYNDFTANGLKCWIFKQKQLTSTPRALVSHTFSSLPNQQKVNEY